MHAAPRDLAHLLRDGAGERAGRLQRRGRESEPEFPASISTTMVSPMARPSPSMTAAKMPDEAAGTVTL